MVMTHRKLMQSVDTRKIEEAIRAAELRTSGEVRVSVSRLFWGDVEKAGRKAFERMGMTQTQQHNAVLFFVVPSRRKFAVLGDTGIHQKVGQEFWERIVSVMSERFRASDF